MAKQLEKKDMYRIERFSPEQLKKVSQDIGDYAQAIGGMPQHHADVFEKRGWLIPFLLAYDELLWKRWLYWTDILAKGTITNSGPIPPIQWTDLSSSKATVVHKMLTHCLEHTESNIDHFADWLLWGLGASEEKPRISSKLNEHYYREFDLFLVLDNPTDYLSHILSEETGRGYKSGLGYFPTPFNIARLMVEVTHGDGDPEVLKRLTVNDPCVGCGVMLLAASNYFLRGYGMDISSIAVKLCTIQMYWYAPWFAKPGQHIEGFDVVSEPIPLALAQTGKKVAEGQLAFVF